MTTFLEYIKFIKGIEYLIVIAFCFGFIALWLLVQNKENVMKKAVSVVIPLSLIFGGMAVVVDTHADPDTNATDVIVPLNHTDINSAAALPASQDKLFRVNNSEYLSITYGPATKFHQVMINKASCKTCHHNSGDEIHACKDCHDAPFNPHDPNKPGLKAAYHELCISCHKDAFNGPESCAKCHTSGSKVTTAVPAPARPHQLTWETCSRCHKSGIPGGQVSKIVYHDSCLKCHTKGIGGAAIIPEDHAGRSGNTCQGCHKPAGG
jgi:hypothetical protein